MKLLTKIVLTGGLSLLCSNVVSASSRNFILEFATLNPSDANEKDTRALTSTGFSASGHVLIDDDTGEAVRTLQICDETGCIKNSETFTATKYSEGTSAVFLREKNDGSSEKMTFVWNYQNLGLMEKLSSKWGRFAGQQLAASWRYTTTTNPNPTRLILPDPVRDADGKFSFVVFPDTQNESHEEVETSRLHQRAEWVVNNKNERDYRFVLHTGDLVNWGWLDARQYDTASAGMAVLEKGMLPYFINLGNHDTRAVGWDGSAYADSPDCLKHFSKEYCNTSKLVRLTEDFNRRFNAERFGSVSGAFESGKVDNAYSVFEIAGKKFMILTLELWPRKTAIDWAKKVVESYPNHNVIVMTHSYLTDDKDPQIFDSSEYGETSPLNLYKTFISQYRNIKMVFSGHTGSYNYRTDIGVNKNKIVSFLQAMHAPDPQQPLREVEIDVSNNKITTKMLDVSDSTPKEYQNSTVVIDDMNWL